jgi:hypothetical protein
MIAPEKVTFYCKSVREDGGVYHAFPVDSSATHDTAKSWATIQDKKWDSEEHKFIYGEKLEPTVFEFENKGFDHVTIQSLSYRGNGGRAYQAIVEVDGNKFRVDLRERTLMDVIFNTGIQAGGRLNGTFCFAKDNSQTNIILEGTEEHKRAVAEREKRANHSKTIKKSELKPGYEYYTISGFRYVYLGSVYTCDVDEDGIISKPYKAMLMITSNGNGTLNYLKTGEVTYHNDRRETSTWRIELLKSHSLKIEKEKVIDVDLPKMLERINNLAEMELSEAMARKSYTRYLSDYTLLYKKAQARVDRKDVVFDESLIRQMMNKVQEYRYRWR